VFRQGRGPSTSCWLQDCAAYRKTHSRRAGSCPRRPPFGSRQLRDLRVPILGAACKAAVNSGGRWGGRSIFAVAQPWAPYAAKRQAHGQRRARAKYRAPIGSIRRLLRAHLRIPAKPTGRPVQGRLDHAKAAAPRKPLGNGPWQGRWPNLELSHTTRQRFQGAELTTILVAQMFSMLHETVPGLVMLNLLHLRRSELE